MSENINIKNIMGVQRPPHGHCPQMSHLRCPWYQKQVLVLLSAWAKAQGFVNVEDWLSVNPLPDFQQDTINAWVAAYLAGNPLDHPNLNNRDMPNQHPLSAITGLTDILNAIQDVIPSTATMTNPLATNAFVNSSIQTMSANPVTYDALGNPFPTYADLASATSFYNQGVAYTPVKGDYTTVLADENYGGAQTRYVFDGTNWIFQSIVNTTPFTSTQLAAINSGITAALVAQIGNSKPLSYSLTEQIVPGVTWIDGSPIYQITHTGTTGATLDAYNNLDLTIPNMGTMVELYGGLQNSALTHLPNNFSAAGNFSFCVNSAGVLQEWHTVAAYSNQAYHVTILYTKV